jgi:hypothetical protein
LKSSALELIAVLFTFVGALGTVVYSCLAMKGGIKLSKVDRAIVGALAMVVLFLVVGSRVLFLWPRLVPEMAEALLFWFLGFIFYWNWRRNRTIEPK